jgi:opacity protein-like surface antigen
MTAKITTSLLLGIALMVVMPNEALAGGDYYSGAGSVKDYGGTPVPAPIPVPIYDPVWYFRGDVGLQFGDAPAFSETGMVFGELYHAYAAEHTFGPNADALKSDFDTSVTYAAGVGYRLNESFRLDVTGEKIRDQSFRIHDRTRAALLHNNAPVLGYLETKYNDQLSTRGGAVLFNAYYDMPAHFGGFTPYIGGGLGFALVGVDRTNTTIEKAYDKSSLAKQDQFSSTSKTEDNQTKLAAMATIGASYRVSDITELDLNYRYFYVDGVDASLLVNGHPSTIETDGTHDHQLRAGVRFNIQ